MNDDHEYDPMVLETGEGDGEDVLVSTAPVNFEGTPRQLFVGEGYHESISSHMSSTHHASMGDFDLASVGSIHSATSHNSSDDILDATTTVTESKKPIVKKKKKGMSCQLIRRYVWYHPWTRAARTRYRRIPARYKYCCFFVWVGWKFVAAFMVLYFVSSATNNDDVDRNGIGGNGTPLRLLYMVTSDTVRTQRRPYAEAWIESVIDLSLNHRYIVDVAFITGDETIDPNLVVFWRQKLPAYAGLYIWTDAIPWRVQGDKVAPQMDALWLQHRFVVKDRWPYYDIFMSWDVDARVTVAHVDYYWRQSRRMADDLVILGFVPVILTPDNQTQSTEEIGPFDSQVCCGATERIAFVRDAGLLAIEEPARHSGENSRMALIPSNDPRQGWMMTNQQLRSLLEECPYFLPSTDDHPTGCSWPRWVDLDPKHYSYHFVQHFTNGTVSSLSPNRLWKELGENDIKVS